MVLYPSITCLILKASKLKTITIDIDSTVENIEGVTNGYPLRNVVIKCYNGLMSFCSELKSFVTGFQKSGNAYTSNGTAEMIKLSLLLFSCNLINL